MPVLVLRLAPTALARLAHGKNSHSGSTDDQDDLSLARKRKKTTIKLKIASSESRDAYGNFVMSRLGDSNHARSVAKGVHSKPFRSAITNAQKRKPYEHGQPQSWSTQELNLEDPLAQMQTHFNQLGGDVKQLGDNVVQLQSQVDQLRGANQHWQSEVKAMHADEETLQTENASLKAVVQKLTLALNDATNEYETLNEGHGDVASEKKDLEIKNRKLEERVKLLELEVKKHREEAEDSRQANNALAWEKVDLATKNNKLEDDVKELQLEIKKGLEETKHSRQAFEAYRKRVKTLGSELWDDTGKDLAK